MNKRSNLIIPAKALLLGAAILGALSPLVARAQDTPPPPAVAAEAPAEEAAPPNHRTESCRPRAILPELGSWCIGRCEVDIQNRQCSGSGPQRMDDDLRCPGIVHDPAGSGPVLRRPGSKKERSQRSRPMSRLRGHGHCDLVGRRL